MNQKRLVTLRKQRGWSQAELARQAGINANTVCIIESGRYLPYPSQLAKLAAALEFADDPARLLDECKIVKGAGDA